MSWIPKEQPTSFDTQPIEGLFFLHGSLLAAWTEGQKYSMIAFPSGLECDLWETSNPKRGGIVHIFGEMDLPLYSNRDEAFSLANDIAMQCGYAAQVVGDDRLEVWGHDTSEHFVMVFDNQQPRITDVLHIKNKKDIRRPATQLLPDELRVSFPKLYSNEKLGLNAQAHVKFFTPDAGWTWYASEFDGEDTFFGLVIGLEIELGYFSLSELSEVRGPLGLPVERDRFFVPQTLGELQEKHLQERRGS
jgi:hypothetical protein